MFRIDKSSVSYKNKEHPYVLLRPVAAKATKLAVVPPSVDSAPADTDNEQAVLVDQKMVKQQKEIAQEILAQAQTQADEILAQAKETAACTTAQAVLQAESVHQEGFAKGYEQGNAEGSQKGMAKYEVALGDMHTLFAQTLGIVEAERVQLIDAMEQECLKLSLDIAQKILGVALSFDESVFLSLVKNGLDAIKHDKQVTLRVSPMEYEVFFAQGSGFLSSDTLSVTVVEDKTLVSGDLILTSDLETVNAGVRRQIQAVRDALLPHDGDTI